MTNTVTQKWFKPSVVVKDAAIASWDEDGKEQTREIKLSYELLVGVSDAIMLSGYNWKGDQANDDVTLTVLNLVNHYTSNAGIIAALEAVKIDGTPIRSQIPRYRHQELAVRNAVLTLGVTHLFAQHVSTDSK